MSVCVYVGAQANKHARGSAQWTESASMCVTPQVRSGFSRLPGLELFIKYVQQVLCVVLLRILMHSSSQSGGALVLGLFILFRDTSKSYCFKGRLNEDTDSICGLALFIVLLG